MPCYLYQTCKNGAWHSPARPAHTPPLGVSLAHSGRSPACPPVPNPTLISSGPVPRVSVTSTHFLYLPPVPAASQLSPGLLLLSSGHSASISVPSVRPYLTSYFCQGTTIPHVIQVSRLPLPPKTPIILLCFLRRASPPWNLPPYCYIQQGVKSN